jgi:hypothetical protein
LTQDIVEGDTSFEDLEDDEHFADPDLLIPEECDLNTLWKQRCESMHLPVTPLPVLGTQFPGHSHASVGRSEANLGPPILTGSQAMVNGVSNGVVGGVCSPVRFPIGTPWTTNGIFNAGYPTFEPSNSNSNRGTVNPAHIYSTPTTSGSPEVVDTTTDDVSEASPANSKEDDFDFASWVRFDKDE